MKSALLCLPLLLTGCAIEKYNQPPAWASVVTTHSRFFGLSLGYQDYSLKVGWGSSTISVVPVSTNHVYAATVSDTFSLGTSLNPFDTQIKEAIQTGYDPEHTPVPTLKLFK